MIAQHLLIDPGVSGRMNDDEQKRPSHSWKGYSAVTSGRAPLICWIVVDGSAVGNLSPTAIGHQRRQSAHRRITLWSDNNGHNLRRPSRFCRWYSRHTAANQSGRRNRQQNFAHQTHYGYVAGFGLAVALT